MLLHINDNHARWDLRPIRWGLIFIKIFLKFLSPGLLSSLSWDYMVYAPGLLASCGSGTLSLRILLANVDCLRVTSSRSF